MKHKAEREVLRLFIEDAQRKGVSLRSYCKELGIDYYQLTGFPEPNKPLSLEQMEGQRHDRKAEDR
jgi:hypothetical protein